MELPPSQHSSDSGGEDYHGAMVKSKKHALLNKFLTKTYHMIDSCDPTIATWNDDGLSFIIHDVAKFTDHVLPRYFKHSKFASFVRQLNFYSFRKMRIVGEEYKIAMKSKNNNHINNKVQFMHDFFQRGRPDLLHKISRVTKAQLDQPPAHYSSEMKTLKNEIASLHQDIVNISQQFDQRLQAVMVAVESDYQQRMSSIALSYETLSTLSGQLLAPRTTTTSTVSSSQPDMVHSTMTTTGSCSHLPQQPPPPPPEAQASSEVMESLKTAVMKTDAIPSATTATFSNRYHHHVNTTTVPGSFTSLNSRYVTDSSSISSREDASPDVASPPSLQQPVKCPLSLLSGIASAIMQELET